MGRNRVFVGRVLARAASWAWARLVVFVCLCVSAALLAGMSTPSAQALDHGGLSEPGSLTVHRLLTSNGQDLGAGDGLVSEEIQNLHGAVPAVGEVFSLYRLDTARVEGAVSGVAALTAAALNEAASADEGTGTTTAILKLIEKYAGQSADDVLVSTATTDSNGEAQFTNLSFAYYVLVADPATALGSAPVTPCVITMPYAGTDGSFVKDVHIYPKTGRDTHISKSVASPKTVVGLGDEVVWNIDFPVPSELKKTINDQVVYGTNWSVYDDVDSRLDLNGIDGANAGRGTVWTMRVTDATGKASTLQPASGDTDVKATWDENSRRLTWQFSDDFLRRVCDEATAVNIRVALTTTVNASAMSNVSTVFNDAVIRFINASGDPFWHRVISRSSGRTSARTAAASEAATASAASAASVTTASVTSVSNKATTVADETADDEDGGTAYGDEDNPLHPRVYIGSISVSKYLQGTDTPLEGAKFALAASEADAKAGRFMTRDGEVFERVSDKNGELTFEAVGEGDYWLVETQAPQCPTSDGKKECAKLAQPVKVTVGSSKADSHPKVRVDNHVKTVIDEIIDKGSTVVDALAKTGLTTGGIFATGAFALALAVIIIVRRRRRASVASATAAAPSQPAPRGVV